MLADKEIDKISLSNQLQYHLPLTWTCCCFMTLPGSQRSIAVKSDGMVMGVIMW